MSIADAEYLALARARARAESIGHNYRTSPQRLNTAEMLALLLEIRAFWAGGDCPADLMARIEAITSQAGAP